MLRKEGYKIETEIFQGPLDLLLNLIESKKMHISDVSLSQIADDYINYLESAEKVSIKSSADFILVASILMLIKSKSLLPDLDLTKEEEQGIEDLEDRLKEYKKIKRLSINISEAFGKKIIFSRQLKRKREIIFSPDVKIQKENLLFLIKNVVKQIPKKINIPKTVVDKAISLEEIIDNLSERIKSSLKMGFKEFSGLNSVDNFSKEKKVNIVLSFLAMLELVKQGAINVNQDNQFGDINMNTQKLDTPNYNQN
ncbi:MAG: segregation/condensation protein A [Candidatus Pacebacteria bacterium]|nr:segregation/condensation protein A [Candidatus Paceibacterota bacterium]